MSRFSSSSCTLGVEHDQDHGVMDDSVFMQKQQCRFMLS